MYSLLISREKVLSSQLQLLLTRVIAVSNVPIVSSQYWNETHGMMPKEQKEDREGMQTMGTLHRNMAWMIKCFKLGKEHGIEFPDPEPFT